MDDTPAPRLLDEAAILIFGRALFATHPDPAKVLDLVRTLRTETVAQLAVAGLDPAFVAAKVAAIDDSLSLLSMGMTDQ